MDINQNLKYTQLSKLRDQLEMGYPNLKWVIPVKRRLSCQL